MFKCIHSDVCSEYNRRYHKKLNGKCSRKCKFYMNDNTAQQYQDSKDTILITAKQVGDIVSDAIMDAYNARRTVHEEMEY